MSDEISGHTNSNKPDNLGSIDQPVHINIVEGELTEDDLKNVAGGRPRNANVTTARR